MLLLEQGFLYLEELGKLLTWTVQRHLLPLAGSNRCYLGSAGQLTLGAGLLLPPGGHNVPCSFLRWFGLWRSAQAPLGPIHRKLSISAW